MSARKLKLTPLYRTFEVRKEDMDAEKRTVSLSFSSEIEVERWFGGEILDHDPKSVDLSRLQSRAPLLVEHDREDQVGVIESAEISNKRGQAIVRFGKSARAEEIFTDVMDGIRSQVSVGYRVNKMALEKEEDGLETYRVTSWTPFEISIVSVPADPTVGIERTENLEQYEVEIDPPITMQRNLIPNILLEALPTGGGGTPTPPPAPVSIEVLRNEVRTAELDRQTKIRDIASRWKDRVPEIVEVSERCIANGTELNEFRKILFDMQPSVRQIPDPDPNIGVSEKDLGRYSFARAITGASEGRLDGLERELSDEFARKANKKPGSFWVPQDVLAHRSMTMKRDLLKGTGSLGGNLVATDLLAASFIEMLRARMVTVRAGATVLNGLVGTTVIPRQTGGVTAYWASETGASTESDATFDQVTLSPKAVTAVQDYSKQLLLQRSLDIENLVRMDLAKTLALEEDRAALHGSGSSNQPTGIASISGIGSVAGGTNGLAPTWANIVALETEVAQDNADLNTLAYITNAKARGKLKNTFISTASVTPIWQGGIDSEMNGYRSLATNQVASNLTKGTSTTVCSAIFFGDWSALYIGHWGGLDILVDPYTQGINRVIRVLASLYTDINARHPESFAAMLDALTT